jgi:hypothetical protein
MTSQNHPEETDRVLDRITDRLDDRYDGTVDRDVIDREVHETYSELAAEAKVDTLLPALTEHEVGDRLAEEVGRPPARTEAEPAEDRPGGELRAGAASEADSGPLGRPVL